MGSIAVGFVRVIERECGVERFILDDDTCNQLATGVDCSGPLTPVPRYN